MKDNTLKWLYAVPGKKKIYIVLLVLIQSLNGASGVLYALFLKDTVDAAAAHSTEGFWHGILLMVLLTVVQLGLRALIRWLQELTRASFENLFKHRLMQTLLARDYASVSAVHTGEWMNRLTNDAQVVANGYADILPGFAEMIVKLISALVMILVLEPRFAAILVPGGALMMLCTWIFRKVLKRMHKDIQEADGRLRIFLQERLGSLMMIRSFAAEEQTLEAADRKLKEHKDARMTRNRFSNLCNIGFGAAMNGMYLLGIGWCGYGILKGTISFGTLTAIMQLVSQIYAPFANLTGYLPKYYAMLASAERLMEAEDFAEDAGRTAMELPAILDFYGNRLTSVGLQDVSFTYYPPAEKLEELSKNAMPVVLHDISFEVRKGEYIALTGISGSGKSTVLKLLMCVYAPDAGERFFTENGRERSELTDAWRRLFAYVPQGNQLMSGTIREIVSFSDPAGARDEERLEQALRAACADGFVAELEQGMDTLLGERGTGLSEGQMQRIAIARAVFSRSPILLLDEATSALDEGTEKELLGNLRSMTDRTVLIVTHRPAALSICDRVLQFTEGGVTEK